MDLRGLQVHLLLEARAGPDARQEVVGVLRRRHPRNTPLILATELGYAEIVGLLLAADANPDQQKYKGVTALICAAEGGNVEIARLLLEASAHVDLLNDFGNTALARASQNGHTQVEQLLTDAGAGTAKGTSNSKPVPGNRRSKR